MSKTKLLLYCTRSKPTLYEQQKLVGDKFFAFEPFIKNIKDIVNGKIVAECDYEVEEIYLADNSYEAWLETKTLNEAQLRDKSCLSVGDLYNYLDKDCGYAIHIKNLKVFDKPKELEECHKEYGKYFVKYYMPIERAPQNMMKVWVFENGKWVIYILISIRSQWMCKILNREKDVEVRRVVLKEMVE